MDERRARIQEDLRGLVAGMVRCDDVFVQMYSTDASVYQIAPLGVVMPRSTADVVATVRYAAENQIPVHARGAGTGLAGETVGPGIVLDFSRYLRRILHTDETTVRVQPGVVHERLNLHLARFGRLFGPDPAMSNVTTMGSVVALDGSGSRWLKYGSARRHTLGLQAVLADGSVIEAGREPLVDGVSHDPNPVKRELINRLVEILAREADLIRSRQPRSLVNRCGYALHDVLGSDYLDLARLLVGSEGTLALFTEITVATHPKPRHQAVAMLMFERLDAAARAVGEILPFEPTTCDLLDRRLLHMAREVDLRYEGLIPPSAEAVLLVECDGDDQAEVREKLRAIVDRVQRRRRLASDARIAFDELDVSLYWELARRVVQRLHRLRGSERPIPFIEDVAIPPEMLPFFLIEMHNLLKKHQVTATLFSHAGHGQLHLRPFLDLANPSDVQRMKQLAAEFYEHTWAVGGTIAGEHGNGLSRTPYVSQQYGPLYRVFAEVKRVFDPQNILNPGKTIGDDPELLTKNLRSTTLARPETNGAPAEEPPQLVQLQLDWSAAEIMHVSRSCNGCGACRDQSREVRMCPIFRVAPAEEASPRAKANLMRAMLAGQLEPEVVLSDRFKEVADLCVNCQMCRLECPAGVDIPKLMLEAKGAYVASNGMRFGDWLMARLDRTCAIGSFFRPLTNWMLGNHQARWLLEKFMGLARGRKLPRFAKRSFLKRAVKRRWTRPLRGEGRKVLYFVDVYANYHDPLLAESLVAVLEHNGVAVYVHPGQKASGMAMLSTGALDHARARAAQNVSLLAEAVRQGYTIIASEPSAALCLTREYPSLLDQDEDSRLVADNSFEACDYLWRMHRQGKLSLDFRPVHATLVYHQPCHLRALEVGSPGENLLRLVPGLRVLRTEDGCSGMAGTYGLKRENYRNSLRAGWGLISSLRRAGFHAGTTECSSCKIQMEQGTTKPTIHPLKLLALAYGLLPENENLLAAKSEELTVT